VTFLIILHVLVCVFLVVVILLQPGKGDAGIGFGSSSQSIFGSKGAGNFLTKTTSICAVLYLGLSFVLTRSRIQESTRSVIDSVPAMESKVPADAAPKAEPEKPVEPQAESKK
jgi:preprotein translocase subunit SecG